MVDTNINPNRFLSRKMLSPPKISGARFIAETLKGYKVTHVFFVESILNRTLVEMEALGYTAC